MKKIAAYKTLGTNDLDASKAFYDGLFEDLETLSFSPNERSQFWVIKGDDSMFAVFNLTMGKWHQWATAA